MNILYLCDEYPPGRHGGIGTVVRSLATELSKQGHNVVVAGFYDWGYGGENHFLDEGVVVYRFRRRLASSLFSQQDSLFVRGLYRLLTIVGVWEWDIRYSLEAYGVFLEDIIKKHSIEIVEMPDYNDYMRFCKQVVPFPKLSVPVVVKMHGCMTYLGTENGNAVPNHIRTMEADLLRRATAACSVSKYNATKTAEYLNYSGAVRVLYNGIEITSLPERPKNTKKVVYTGTLTEAKGAYQLMKAWNRVNEKVPDSELHVFGKGPIKKVKRNLAPKAANTVFFHGHVKKSVLMEHLADALVAVFPSFAESFSLAPMEAMVCNTAVIYTNRTSGPELVTDAWNGLLVNPANSVEIADAMCFLLMNTEKAAELAKNGKITIEQNFSISRTAGSNISYYTELLSNRELI